MDIQTKDGIVLRGIPEGTPEEAIKARLAQIRAQRDSTAPVPTEPDAAERIAGSAPVRFALGAAAPVLGAVQLGANLIGQGEGINEHLARLEEMKRRGMKSDGFDIAGLLGSVFSPATLAAMKLPVAASLLGRSGQGAALGAAFGASTPVTDADNFASAKLTQAGTGALIGGAIPPVIDAVRLGASAARNIVDPMLPGGAQRSAARLVSQAAGDRRPQIEALLAEGKVNAPGSVPTAAEAAAPAGSPTFSALQRFAAARQPEAYSDIATRQEAARQAAVQRVGGTAEQLASAERVRSATSKVLYDRAGQQIIVPRDEILPLFNRPSMKEAMKEASNRAAERDLAFGSLEKGFSVDDFQRMKMALDDMVRNPERFGIGASKAKDISGTRDKFVTWLAKESPLWNQARQIYARQSQGINEMQVGQELERALTKPVGEGERAGVFAQAVRDAPRTIKKATGQPRFDQLEDVLSTDNLKSVRGVLDDLKREAQHQGLSRLGQQRANEILQPFGLPATGPLNQQYMIFKTVLGRVSRGVNDKVLDEIATALQTPVSALKLLRSAPDEARQRVIDGIIGQKLGRAAIAAGAISAAEGAQQQ